MAKAELKTKKTKKSVAAFIDSIPSPTRRRDAAELLKIMKEITKKKPAMWGPSIVGFGDHTYKYESGREVDFFLVGFSARKDTSTLYLMSGYEDTTMQKLLKKLGPHKRGAGCLYLKDLEQIHRPTLKKLIQRGYQQARRM